MFFTEEDIQKFSAAAEDEIGKGNAAAQQLGKLNEKMCW